MGGDRAPDLAVLRHALRQPLFAMMLAAENGAMLLESGSPEHLARAAAKFAVILEQIAQVQAILLGDGESGARHPDGSQDPLPLRLK